MLVVARDARDATRRHEDTARNPTRIRNHTYPVVLDKAVDALITARR